jgi:excisionase family DNA binding protein
LWVALETDWARRASRSDAGERLARWKHVAPQLDGFCFPAEIVQAIGYLGHPEQSCCLLNGLLLVAHDPLAAYAVLVALIPGLRVAAGRRWQTAWADGPWMSRDELDADTVSAAWHAIAVRGGQQHPRPARLIIRSLERHLRNSHDAQRRWSARTLPRENLDIATTLGLDDQDSAQWVALGLVESTRSGRLDPITFDIAYRIALLDERASKAGSRHGLDHRRTLTTLRSALDVIAVDRPGPIAPSKPQEVHALSSRSQPSGLPRGRNSSLPLMPLLLTVKQAAELLGIGRSTVYELLDAGDLKSVKLGFSRRIPLKVVEDYIEHLLSDHHDDNAEAPTQSASLRIAPIRENDPGQ